MKVAWKLISSVLGIILLISLYYNFRNPNATGNVTKEVASQKAVAVLQGLVQPGTSLKINNVQTESGLYNISLTVNSQPANVFVTTDGKYLFPSIVDMQNPQQPGQAPQPAPAQGNISGFDVSGQPAEGSINATTTIIEFSDFQCPFCGQFFSETYPQLKKDYIDTGIAKLVFVNFPLSNIHQYAEKAAEAGMCAYDQGRFWEMHDKMFSNQNTLTVNDLKKYAGDIGLNTTKFNDCLDTGKNQAKVNGNFQAGVSAGVTGTPSFFVNGKMITGAQPFSVFQQAIGQ
jgi:protein-disulfide isomerase